MPRKKVAHHALEVVTQNYWAMLPSALEQMLSVIQRENLAPEAVAAKLGRPLDNTHRVTVRDGVATIPVRGPLFRYANLFTQLSGATSYETVARDLTTTLEDPNVKSIILAIDSPGGEVNGCQELAQLVFQARGQKPVVAHVSGLGASGAYWIASAADEIVATETAILGSIGVAATFVDTSEAEAQAGVRVIDIISNQSPKKWPDPADDAGRAQIQRTIDGLAAVFVGTVARNRGVDADVVLSDYGQGDVLVGLAAVDAGLADRIATYEQLHAELSGADDQKRVTRDFMSSTREFPMAAEDKDKQTKTPAAEAAPAAPAGPATPAPVAAPAQAAPQVAAPTVEQIAGWRKEGADQERTRILAIEKLGALGHKELVQQCKEDPSCTPEQAALKIADANRAAQDRRFKAVRQDEEKLDPPAPLDPAATEATSDEALARQIVATGQLVFGRPQSTKNADRS